MPEIEECVGEEIEGGDFHVTSVDPYNRFDNFADPTIETWNNVTFADVYYRDLPLNSSNKGINNDIIANADWKIDLSSMAPLENKATNVFEWYEGTADFAEPVKPEAFRQLGDLYTTGSDDLSETWYAPDHIAANFERTDTKVPWEGIGTGWFHSLLGGGYNLRPYNVDGTKTKASEIGPLKDYLKNQRTSVSTDNTYVELNNPSDNIDPSTPAIGTRLRGDYAVPTLFNGNFDATAYNAGTTQPIAGWSFIGNTQTSIPTQAILKSWAQISGLNNSANYPNNFALELSDNQSITHSPFVVPDWGAFRFDLHTGSVEPDGPGRLEVTIKDENGNIISTEIFLQDALGTPGEYLGDTQKIGYGEQGFETFILDVPDELRGKVATASFKLIDGGTVYIDNVFFKSQHLLLGNPTEARKPDDENTYSTNFLLEKPQYAVSYNDNKQTPNWVSYVLNKNWLGDIPEARDYLPDPTLPDSFYTVPGDAYSRTDEFGYDNGHLTPLFDRLRTKKDRVAVNLRSNLFPQDSTNNSGFWRVLETDLRSLVSLESANRELHITTGNISSRGRIQKAIQHPGLNVNIPEDIWKIVLVQDMPVSNISDIKDDALAFAVYAPNNDFVRRTNWRSPEFGYVRSVREVEDLTGYNFFSNVSIDIQDSIEDRTRGEIHQRLSQLFDNAALSSPLLAQVARDIGETWTSTSAPDGTIRQDSIAVNISASDDEVFNTQEISVGKVSTSLTTLELGISEVSPSEIGTVARRNIEVGPTAICIHEGCSIKLDMMETSFSQLGPSKAGTNQFTPAELGTSHLDSSKVGTRQVTIHKLAEAIKIGFSEISSNQIRHREVNVSEIDSSQFRSDEVTSWNTQISEKSLPSSITLQQFLSSHNYNSQNTTIPTWLQFLQDSTPFNLNIEITDLPTGQLAVACWR